MQVSAHLEDKSFAASGERDKRLINGFELPRLSVQLESLADRQLNVLAHWSDVDPCSWNSVQRFDSAEVSVTSNFSRRCLDNFDFPLGLGDHDVNGLRCLLVGPTGISRFNFGCVFTLRQNRRSS